MSPPEAASEQTQHGDLHETDLEVIRHIEVEISDRLQQAQEEGDRQIKAARSKADQIRAEADQEAREQAQEHYELLVSEYQQAADERISEAHDTAQALREQFSNGIEAEAEAIVRMVAGTGGTDDAD